MAAKPRSAKTRGAVLPSTTAKGGRPSDYTPELGNQICQRIAAGETLRGICRDAAMPNRSTVHQWLLRQKDFREIYMLARELQTDVICDEILEIADDASADFTVDKDGKEIPNWEAPQRSRLRVDARKWFCAKVAPKKYGDRLEMSGPAGGPIEVDAVASSRLFPLEIVGQMTALLDRMEAEMGLPVNAHKRPEARLRAILDTGNPVPPELFYVLHQKALKAQNVP